MRGAVGEERRAVRTPDSLSIPITVANTPSGVWMMSLTQTPKCFRSASAVSISFFLPLPFLPPFFGIVRVFCLRSLSQLAFNAESRYSALRPRARTTPARDESFPGVPVVHSPHPAEFCSMGW
jgi:hypothetical protein